MVAQVVFVNPPVRLEFTNVPCRYAEDQHIKTEKLLGVDVSNIFENRDEIFTDSIADLFGNLPSVTRRRAVK